MADGSDREPHRETSGGAPQQRMAAGGGEAAILLMPGRSGRSSGAGGTRCAGAARGRGGPGAALARGAWHTGGARCRACPSAAARPGGTWVGAGGGRRVGPGPAWAPAPGGAAPRRTVRKYRVLPGPEPFIFAALRPGLSALGRGPGVSAAPLSRCRGFCARLARGRLLRSGGRRGSCTAAPSPRSVPSARPGGHPATPSGTGGAARGRSPRRPLSAVPLCAAGSRRGRGHSAACEATGPGHAAGVPDGSCRRPPPGATRAFARRFVCLLARRTDRTWERSGCVPVRRCSRSCTRTSRSPGAPALLPRPVTKEGPVYRAGLCRLPELCDVSTRIWEPGAVRASWGGVPLR